jgi:hypothetical protein
LQFELLFFSTLLIRISAKNLKLQNDKFGTPRTIDLLLKRIELAGILFFVLLKNKSLRLGFSNHHLIDVLHFIKFHVVCHSFNQII